VGGGFSVVGGGGGGWGGGGGGRAWWVPCGGRFPIPSPKNTTPTQQKKTTPNQNPILHPPQNPPTHPPTKVGALEVGGMRSSRGGMGYGGGGGFRLRVMGGVIFGFAGGSGRAGGAWVHFMWVAWGCWWFCSGGAGGFGRSILGVVRGGGVVGARGVLGGALGGGGWGGGMMGVGAGGGVFGGGGGWG